MVEMTIEETCYDCGATFDVSADGTEEVFKNTDDGYDDYPVGTRCPGCAE